MTKLAITALLALPLMAYGQSKPKPESKPVTPDATHAQTVVSTPCNPVSAPDAFSQCDIMYLQLVVSQMQEPNRAIADNQKLLENLRKQAQAYIDQMKSQRPGMVYKYYDAQTPQGQQYPYGRFMTEEKAKEEDEAAKPKPAPVAPKVTPEPK